MMKTRFIFLVFALIFCYVSICTGQRVRVQSTNTASPDWIDIDTDCISTFPVTDFFDVSGVPSGYRLDQIGLFWLRRLNPLDLQVTLRSPSGTSITLTDTDLGSWPDMASISMPNDFAQFNMFINNCSSLSHTDPFAPSSCSTSDRVQAGTVDPLSAFDGEDMNGTWTIDFCGGTTSDVRYANLRMFFVSNSHYADAVTLDNASTCTASDGSITFTPRQGSNCGFSSTIYYSVDGGSLIAVNPLADPCGSSHPEITVGDLAPGSHLLQFAVEQGGAFVIFTASDYPFTIGSDDLSGANANVCPPDTTVALSSSSIALAVPEAGGCVSTISNIEYSITDPSGNMSGPFTVSGGFAPQETFDQVGDYTILWGYNTIDIGGTAAVTSCTQIISADPATTVSFTSPLCADPSLKEVITQCQTSADSRFIPLEVSGLPSSLSGEFGLLSVYIDATFFADLVTTSPFVDIRDPEGNRHRLFNPASFPQYDFMTQDFEIFIAACNSTALFGADDDIPFLTGNTVKPMGGNILNAVNLSGVNPNGTWELQVCGGTPDWELNCFRLDFGGTCARIEESDLQLGGTCTPTISLSLADIDIPFCEDQDGNGTPDYYLSVDGAPFALWGSSNDYVVETTAGTHDVEFGTVFVDAAGNPQGSCTQTFTVDVPAVNDTEAPALAGCPGDATQQVDSDNRAAFTIASPTATDNCGVSSLEVTVSFVDGAIDVASVAGTMTLDPTQSAAQTYMAEGTGRILLDYVVTDDAGNTSTCQAVLTAVNNDPCINDTEAPVLTNCPADETAEFVSGLQFAGWTAPTYSDNCAVVSATGTILVTLDDGTVIGPDPIPPFPSGGTGLVVAPQGPGVAVLTFVVTDDAGNSASCQTTFTATFSDPCTDDTEDPVLTNCPDDLTLGLGANGQESFNVTYPDATDNCAVTAGVVVFTYLDGATDENGMTSRTFGYTPGTFGFQVVGAGRIEIEFRVEDAAGNSASCTSLVTVIGNNDPCAMDTEAPVFASCPASETLILEPDGSQLFSIVDPSFSDNCPIASAEVTITLSGGTTFASGSTGGVFNIEPGMSFTYDVVGAGLASFDFVVTDVAGNTAQCIVTYTLLEPTGACENDTEAPVLTNCPGPQVVVLDNGEGRASFVTPDATDNCAIDRLQVVNVFSDGAVGSGGTSVQTFPSIPPGGTSTPLIVGAGTLTSTYTAYDPAGNESQSCVVVINAVLPGDDVLFTIAEACAVAGVNTTLPVTVTNFEGIEAFSFDLVVPDDSGLSFVGIENQNLDGLSVNVLGNGDLRVGWNDPAGNAVTLADNRRIFDIVITADTDFDTPSTVTGVDLDIFSAVNESGSINTATICVGQSVMPVGDIVSPLGRPHADVLVNLLAGPVVVGQATTDAAGAYDFGTSETSARVLPVKNDGLREGITIADVARIRRHFLQTRLLESEYQLMAADVNKDGKVNIRDVAINNQILLLKRSAFPGNTPWRFVPANLDISDNPLDVNIANDIRLDAAATDIDNLDFISVKTGDVDHSSLADGRKGNDRKSVQTIALIVPDTIVSPTEEVRLPVQITGDEAISLLSMTMVYDTNHVRLVGIESGLLPGFNAGNFTDLGGEVLIAWDHPQGDVVTGAGALMTLVFESVATTGKADIVLSDLNFQDIDFEAFEVTSVTGSIDFSPTSTGDIEGAISINASPNPFVDQATVEISIPTAQRVSVSIFDASGRLLTILTTPNEARQHSIRIDDLDAKGVLLLQVQGDDFTKVLRMIKI